jgi:hypothetical protein
MLSWQQRSLHSTLLTLSLAPMQPIAPTDQVTLHPDGSWSVVYSSNPQSHLDTQAGSRAPQSDSLVQNNVPPYNTAYRQGNQQPHSGTL